MYVYVCACTHALLVGSAPIALYFLYASASLCASHARVRMHCLAGSAPIALCSSKNLHEC